MGKVNRKKTVNRLDDKSRTERYWTATILPSLLMRDDFKGIAAFLEILAWNSKEIVFKNRKNETKKIGLNDLKKKRWNHDTIQIATELWFLRDISEINVRDKSVPDLAILLEGAYLIVCEAKFFQNVKQSSIESQIRIQKDTIRDILETNDEIQYVHHAFLYGGTEQFSRIKGADSIITWDQVYDKFKKLYDAGDYCITVLGNGIANYKKEFTEHATVDHYYVEQGDFIDIIAKCHMEQDRLFMGLGHENDAVRTFESLVEAAKEEFEVLRENNKKGYIKTRKKPSFLKDKKYKDQSALEFLFVHNHIPYKIDYDDESRGSGDDKKKNAKWIKGTDILHYLKSLTRV